MRAPRPRHDGPLYITCQYDRCGQIRQVRDRRVQAFQRYCSPRCGVLARNGRTTTTEARRQGGLMAGSKARQRVLARVQHLTPLDAFRLGYMRGLHSKHRQIKRRVGYGQVSQVKG